MAGKTDKVLEGKFPRPQLQVVVSQEANAYVGSRQRYNPDELQRRGGLKIYKDMRLDEQVKAVMIFKRDAIFARGWKFGFDTDSSLAEEEQKRRILVFTKMIERVPGGFIDALNLVATGREFGYSLTEKVYDNIQIDSKVYLGLGAFMGRDPCTFIFNTDEFSMLKSCVQEVNGKKLPIDLNKFVHYVHAPEFDLYFGRSDLREAYKSWFWKQKMLDFWMLYGERLAGGVAVASIESGAAIQPNSAAWNSLVNTIENIKSVSGVVLPQGVTLEIIQPTTTDHFKIAVEFFDLAIARSLLVPNLLGVSHTGQTGAYAQSQTQLEAFFWTLNSDKKRIESCLNDQLFTDLGDQNFGDGEYPRFSFKELSSERLKLLIENWSKMVGANIVVATEEDERYFRSVLEMPERTEDDTPLITPAMEAAQKVSEANAALLKTKANGGNPVDDEENLPPKSKPDERVLHESIAQAIEAAFTKHLDVQAALPKQDDRSKPAAFRRAFQRVHFAVIRDKQQEAAASLAGSLGQFVAKTVSALLGSDDDLAKLIDTDVSDIADLEVPSAAKSKLKELITRSLNTSWQLGKNMALNELDRARTEFTRRYPDATPYAYERRNFAALRDKAADYFSTKGFRMAGDVSDRVRSLLQAELETAVRVGKSPTQARVDIWNALVNKGYTARDYARQENDEDKGVVDALNELWLDSEGAAAAYLDTLTRTNLFEAMNEARYAEFTDPELADFVEGLEYSAILDDRTTEICQELDGMHRHTDDDVWSRLRPPNHYNCRSLLIPITKGDDWDGQDDPVPNVQPQVGFK